MSRPALEHLTESELDDVLIGGLPELSADAQQHLEACELCKAEFAALAEPIASFNEVSLAWSERRAATMPARPEPEAVEAAQPAWQRLLTVRTLTVSGTAAAAVVAGLSLVPHGAPEAAAAHSPAHPLAAATDFAPGRAARIAHDNEMLADIDRMLEDSPADLQDSRSSRMTEASQPVPSGLQAVRVSQAHASGANGVSD